MLVACRLAGLSALEGTMQASTSARNLGRRAMPSRPSASFPPKPPVHGRNATGRVLATFPRRPSWRLPRPLGGSTTAISPSEAQPCRHPGNPCQRGTVRGPYGKRRRRRDACPWATPRSGTQAAYDAICATLSLGSVGYEAEASATCGWRRSG
jgi:hypothetical protein